MRLLSLALLFTVTAKAQTDTLPTGAYSSAFTLANYYGVQTDTHPYAFGNIANTETNATLVKFDLVNKHITTISIDNNQQGVAGWNQAMDSTGRWFATRGTGTREIYALYFKTPDSIGYKNLRNSGQSGLCFGYTYTLGRTGRMGIGNNSCPDNTSFAIYSKTGDSLIKYPEADASQQYNYGVVEDTDGWIYTQVGQSVYRIYAYNPQTLEKKLLLQRNDQFMDLHAYQNGVFVYRNDSGIQYKLLGGDTIRVAIDYNKGDLIAYWETKRFSVNEAGNKPYVAAFYDAARKRVYYKNNNTLDSIDFDGGEIPMKIRILAPDRFDSNIIRFIGEPYGLIHTFYKAQDSLVTHGFPGINAYSLYQLNDSIIYMSGYPSGTTIMWNINQQWTAETINYSTGGKRVLSTTTTPKIVAVFSFDHANDLTLVDDRYLCATGNNIRDKNTASIGVIDTQTDSAWEYDDDFMDRQYWSDITAWRTKLLFSTNDGNGGTPHIYIFNPATNTKEDSITLDFKNYGTINVVGDCLFGIAQDSTNRVRFYKVHLPTKELTYNYTTTGTLNFCQWMPDGFIGINTTGVTLPKDFLSFRTVNPDENKFDGVGGYYTLYNNQGNRYQILYKPNISSYTVDQETAQGKEKMLIELYK